MTKLKNLISIIKDDIKVNNNLALEFLKSNITRKYFIDNYEYFNLIDRDILVSFIKKNFNDDTSSEFKISLLELSIALNCLIPSLFGCIKSDLQSRKTYLLKLTYCDYINNFYEEDIVKRYYNDINIYLSKNSRNEIVRFQANINLILYDYTRYSNTIFKFLMAKNVHSYFYYRFANTLLYKQFQNLGLQENFKEILDKTDNLNGKQIEEIKSYL